MRMLVGVMVAGALGAAVRYGLDGVVSRRLPGAFPWGTLAVNLSGCLLVGLLYTLLVDRFRVDPALRTAVIVGFIGSYTTFSTLMLESTRLLQDRSYALALANAAGSVVLGLLAVSAGILLARAL